MFDGEHVFTIETLESKRVRFIQHEVFTGLLVPLFARLLGVNTQRGFEEMNNALKVQAEETPVRRDRPIKPHVQETYQNLH